MRTRSIIAGLAFGWTGHVMSGPPVKVPRGPAPVVDGKVDSVEWRGSAIEQLANGLTVRLRHDGAHLFLGVTSSSGEGFPSVCAVRNDTIRVLHASAALGAILYSRAAGQTGGGSVWSTRDTAFVYGMRNTALNENASRERSEYLSRHGWVGSTFRMGQGRAHEIQLSLELLDPASSRRPRIALGYYREGGAPVTWPESLAAAGEGCAEPHLIQGSVPPHSRFGPEMYVELALQ
jgi:hypothetical protein